MAESPQERSPGVLSRIGSWLSWGWGSPAVSGDEPTSETQHQEEDLSETSHLSAGADQTDSPTVAEADRSPSPNRNAKHLRSGRGGGDGPKGHASLGQEKTQVCLERTSQNTDLGSFGKKSKRSKSFESHRRRKSIERFDQEKPEQMGRRRSGRRRRSSHGERGGSQTKSPTNSQPESPATTCLASSPQTAWVDAFEEEDKSVQEASGAEAPNSPGAGNREDVVRAEWVEAQLSEADSQSSPDSHVQAALVFVESDMDEEPVVRLTESAESKRRSIKVSHSEKFFPKKVVVNPETQNEDKAAKDTTGSKWQRSDERARYLEDRVDSNRVKSSHPKGRIADKINLFERGATNANPRHLDISPARNVAIKDFTVHTGARSSSAPPKQTVKERVMNYSAGRRDEKLSLPSGCAFKDGPLKTAGSGRFTDASGEPEFRSKPHLHIGRTDKSHDDTKTKSDSNIGNEEVDNAHGALETVSSPTEEVKSPTRTGTRSKKRRSKDMTQALTKQETGQGKQEDNRSNTEPDSSSKVLVNAVKITSEKEIEETLIKRPRVPQMAEIMQSTKKRSNADSKRLPKSPHLGTKGLKEIISMDEKEREDADYFDTEVEPAACEAHPPTFSSKTERKIEGTDIDSKTGNKKQAVEESSEGEGRKNRDMIVNTLFRESRKPDPSGTKEEKPPSSEDLKEVSAKDSFEPANSCAAASRKDAMRNREREADMLAVTEKEPITSVPKGKNASERDPKSDKTQRPSQSNYEGHEKVALAEKQQKHNARETTETHTRSNEVNMSKPNEQNAGRGIKAKTSKQCKLKDSSAVRTNDGKNIAAASEEIQNTEANSSSELLNQTKDDQMDSIISPTAGGDPIKSGVPPLSQPESWDAQKTHTGSSKRDLQKKKEEPCTESKEGSTDKTTCAEKTFIANGDIHSAKKEDQLSASLGQPEEKLLSSSNENTSPVIPPNNENQPPTNNEASTKVSEHLTTKPTLSSTDETASSLPGTIDHKSTVLLDSANKPSTTDKTTLQKATAIDKTTGPQASTNETISSMSSMTNENTIPTPADINKPSQASVNEKNKTPQEKSSNTTTKKKTDFPVSTNETTSASPASTNEKTTPLPSTTSEKTTSPPASTNEQATPLPTTTSEKTTPSPASTNEQATPPKPSTNEQATPPPASINEQATPLPTTTSEQATPPKPSTNEQTTLLTTTTNEQATPPKPSTNEQTTLLTTTTNEQATPPKPSTNERATLLSTTTNEKTTPSPASTNEPQTTPLPTTTNEKTTPSPASTNEPQTTPLPTTNNEKTTPPQTSANKQVTPLPTATNEKTTPPPASTNEQATPLVTTTSEKATPPPAPTNEQATPPKASTNEQATPLPTTTSEKTTPPPASTNEQATPLVTTTSEKTIPPQVSANEQTTPLPTTTNGKTTPPPASTNEQATPLVTTTSEKTIPPQVSANEQTTPLPTTTNGKTTPPPASTNNQATRLPTTTSEKTTPPPASTNEPQTLPLTTKTNEKTTTPLVSTNEKTTTPPVLTNEKTPPPTLTSEQAKPPPVSTNEKTTTPPVLTNEKTTTPPVMTNEKTTPPPTLTSEQAKPPPVSTNEKTTAPPVLTNEKTTPPPTLTSNQTTPPTASTNEQATPLTTKTSKKTKPPPASTNEPQTTPLTTTTNEKPTPPLVSTNEKTTTPPVLTNEKTTPSPSLTSEQAKPPPVSTNENTTTPPVLVNEKTTPPPTLTGEQTKPPPASTNEKTTPPPASTNEQTTPLTTTTNEKPTPPLVSTNEKTTTPPVLINEKTTPPPTLTSEKTTPPPVSINEKSASSTNDKTTPPSASTSEQTTPPPESTNEKFTPPSASTGEKTTPPPASINEKTTTSPSSTTGSNSTLLGAGDDRTTPLTTSPSNLANRKTSKVESAFSTIEETKSSPRPVSQKNTSAKSSAKENAAPPSVTNPPSTLNERTMPQLSSSSFPMTSTSRDNITQLPLSKEKAIPSLDYDNENTPPSITEKAIPSQALGKEKISHTLASDSRNESADPATRKKQFIPKPFFLPQIPLPPGSSSSHRDSPSSWLDVDHQRPLRKKQLIPEPKHKLSSSVSETNLDTSGEFNPDDFIANVKRLAMPFNLPQRKHNHHRLQAPPFAMPAIREDHFEKPFDPEEFQHGLRKRREFILDLTPGSVTKSQDTEAKEAETKPKRESILTRSLIFQRKGKESNKEEEQKEEGSNESTSEPLQMRSRLERCSIVSLLRGSSRTRHMEFLNPTESPSNGQLSPSDASDSTTSQLASTAETPEQRVVEDILTNNDKLRTQPVSQIALKPSKDDGLQATPREPSATPLTDINAFPTPSSQVGLKMRKNDGLMQTDNSKTTSVDAPVSQVVLKPTENDTPFMTPGLKTTSGEPTLTVLPGTKDPSPTCGTHPSSQVVLEPTKNDGPMQMPDSKTTSTDTPVSMTTVTNAKSGSQAVVKPIKDDTPALTPDIKTIAPTFPSLSSSKSTLKATKDDGSTLSPDLKTTDPSVTILTDTISPPLLTSIQTGSDVVLEPLMLDQKTTTVDPSATMANDASAPPPLPSFDDIKLPGYLEKFLPKEPGADLPSNKIDPLAAKESASMDLNKSVDVADRKISEVMFPPAPQVQDAQIPQRELPNIPTIRGIHRRPGKIVIFEHHQFNGQSFEFYRDQPDATHMQLSTVISIKVVRGCWILYEKPGFEGRSIALEEECIVELPNQWAEEGGETCMVIGSIRLAVRDYTPPRIELFTEPAGRGRSSEFVDHAEEVSSFSLPQSTGSIKVHSGLWLVYSDPGFQGLLAVLEAGEYPFPEDWGFPGPVVGSLRPLCMGSLKVEKPNAVKAVLYEKAGFKGRCVEVQGDVFSFTSTDTDDPENHGLIGVESLKILGGLWVGYELEGFDGQQFILEEGEYLDWSDWCGTSQKLLSLRPLLMDSSPPHVKMFSEPDFSERGVSIDLLEPLENLANTHYGTQTRSIEVLAGVWLAFGAPGFSGQQYVLEKGLYGGPEDWGASDSRICSTIPVMVENLENSCHFQIELFSESDCGGTSVLLQDSLPIMPQDFSVHSCRVLLGSWQVFGGQSFSGVQCVLEEGVYPDLRTMGFLHPHTSVQSLQPIGHEFSVASVVLFERCGLRGRRTLLKSSSVNLQLTDSCTRVSSVLVEGGMWVLYEANNFRGSQILLKPGAVPDLPKLSSWQRIGSLRPLIQKQMYFHLRNKESGLLMSVTGPLEDIKLMRIQVTEETGGANQIWTYQDGHLLCKCVMECRVDSASAVLMSGSRAVLSSDVSRPQQLWNITSDGVIRNNNSPNLVLEVKGGQQFDKSQIIFNEFHPNKRSQRWSVEIL